MCRCFSLVLLLCCFFCLCFLTSPLCLLTHAIVMLCMHSTNNVLLLSFTHVLLSAQQACYNSTNSNQRTSGKVTFEKKNLEGLEGSAPISLTKHTHTLSQNLFFLCWCQMFNCVSTQHNHTKHSTTHLTHTKHNTTSHTHCDKLLCIMLLLLLDS